MLLKTSEGRSDFKYQLLVKTEAEADMKLVMKVRRGVCDNKTSHTSTVGSSR